MKNVRSVPRLAPRNAAAHKGDFGTVLVVAGSRAMLGAAVLCARAALRGGAGLVCVAPDAELQPLLPLAVPEATTTDRSARSLRAALAKADAVVVGPGLTADAATKRLVRLLLDAARCPLVLDADALNVLAPLDERLVAAAPLVLTPHPGEAARLLGTTTQQVQADRRAAAQQLCERVDGVVVLKGEGTLVADGARCFTNTTGNPGMATGGAGDVGTGKGGSLHLIAV